MSVMQKMNEMMQTVSTTVKRMSLGEMGACLDGWGRMRDVMLAGNVAVEGGSGGGGGG